MTIVASPKTNTDRSAGPAPDSGQDDLDGRQVTDDDVSLQDWVEAENARPTLPDETADGLNDMEEEIRHQAEDLPLEPPGRT